MGKLWRIGLVLQTPKEFGVNLQATLKEEWLKASTGSSCETLCSDLGTVCPLRVVTESDTNWEGILINYLSALGPNKLVRVLYTG